MIRRVLVVGAVVVMLAAGMGGFFAFYRPAAGDALEVEIAPGATTAQIASQLRAEEIIGSDFWFRTMSWLRGLEGRIQAGRYEMRRGMGVQAALDLLSQPPEERAVALTVPEGFSLRQIGARLGGRTHVPEAEFLAVAMDGSIRAAIQPPHVTTLEGLLFPETYLVLEREGAADVARRMVRTFDEATAELDWSGPEQRGLSRYEAIVVASLVEREARVPEDRDKVAAVIYNRLARGMRLQIDITALYGLDEHKVPTRADLQRPSPYNTYLIDGLPPTPIANPGADAIHAALHPAPIDALYYVVIDPSGKHGFTADPQEFERLKQMRPAEVRGG